MMAKFSLILEGRKQHTFSALDISEAQALALKWALYHGELRSTVDVAEYGGDMAPTGDEFMDGWRKPLNCGATTSLRNVATLRRPAAPCRKSRPPSNPRHFVTHPFTPHRHRPTSAAHPSPYRSQSPYAVAQARSRCDAVRCT